MNRYAKALKKDERRAPADWDRLKQSKGITPSDRRKISSFQDDERKHYNWLKGRFKR